MKKNSLFAFVICLLLITSKSNAQCGVSGTTATCESYSSSSSLVSYADTYWISAGVPFTFYIDQYVYGPNGFSAIEVDWGYSGMHWNTIYTSQANYSIPISSSDNTNGFIWLSTSAVDGRAKTRATW